MRKNRIFILGFIAGIVMTMVVPAMADSIRQTIEVTLNSVNLQVNGQKIDVDNILYNGTTYVPMRAVAEALNKDVLWDSINRTANIADKANIPPEHDFLTDDKQEDKSAKEIEQPKLSYEDFVNMFNYKLLRTTENNEIITEAKYKGKLNKTEFIELWYSIDDKLKSEYAEQYGRQAQSENPDYILAIYFSYDDIDLGYMFAYNDNTQVSSFVKNPFKINIEIRNPF